MNAPAGGPDNVGVGAGWSDDPVPDRATSRSSDHTSYVLVRPEATGAAVPTLDEDQQRVVDHAGGPMLVLAGGALIWLVMRPREQAV